MLRDVVVVFCCRAHLPAIQAATHVDHAYLSISLHACSSVPILMVLRLVASRTPGAPILLISFRIKLASSTDDVSDEFREPKEVVCNYLCAISQRAEIPCEQL